MLGLRRRGCTFSVDPCIPSSWLAYEITCRLERTTYVISVSNPERQCRGVYQAFVDDDIVDVTAIPIVDDGRTHHVRIIIGRRSSSAS